MEVVRSENNNYNYLRDCNGRQCTGVLESALKLKLSWCEVVMVCWSVRV